MVLWYQSWKSKNFLGNIWDCCLRHNENAEWLTEKDEELDYKEVQQTLWVNLTQTESQTQFRDEKNSA